MLIVVFFGGDCCVGQGCAVLFLGCVVNIVWLSGGATFFSVQSWWPLLPLLTSSVYSQKIAFIICSTTLSFC